MKYFRRNLRCMQVQPNCKLILDVKPKTKTEKKIKMNKTENGTPGTWATWVESQGTAWSPSAGGRCRIRRRHRHFFSLFFFFCFFFFLQRSYFHRSTDFQNRKGCYSYHNQRLSDGSPNWGPFCIRSFSIIFKAQILMALSKFTISIIIQIA